MYWWHEHHGDLLSEDAEEDIDGECLTGDPGKTGGWVTLLRKFKMVSKQISVLKPAVWAVVSDPGVSTSDEAPS